MPTIKTKKEMNLPELIEWGFKNDIKNAVYNSKNGLSANFSFDGRVVIVDAFSKEDTFTVEVEEEITEDTVIPKVIAVFKHNANLYTDRLFSKSINEILKLDDKVTSSVTKTIYVLNNDGTLTLIWRDGKLVE